MSTYNDERRRSSGSKLANMLNTIRRASLVRRSSSEKDVPAQSSLAQSVAKRPSMDSVPGSVKSPSLRSSRSASSLRAPTVKLNSSSPASELPTTWAEWNHAYQNGFIDFDDPPPPPSDLRSSEHATITGHFRAPFPANEAKRQRAVDNVNLLFNHPTGRKRRASAHGPKDKSDPPPTIAPPPAYENKATGPVGEKGPVPPAYPAAEPVEVSVIKAEVAKKEGAPDKPLTCGKHRQNAPIHPALEALAQKAKAKFGVSATTVSLMDRDEQVFLSESTCAFLHDRDAVPRELTCCSHAMLKASTGTKDPLVVLDFAKDWRFAKNGFGDYQSGFYAAAPIMLPAPLGDDAGSYPAGIFCLLGEKPRPSFTDSERADLVEMADEASLEIQKFSARQRLERKNNLSKKRQTWKKSKLVWRVSGQPNLDTVVETPTPPMTPDMSTLNLSTAEDQEEDELFLQAGESYNAPRRPSLAESIESGSSDSDLQTTSTPPAFSQRGGRPGVLVPPPTAALSDLQSVLDLSTQLVAESIEVDFAYVLAVDLPAARKWIPASSSASSTSPLRFIAVHGMPIPPPLLSVDLHLDALTFDRQALLFTNDSFDGADGEFSTGLLVKIAQVEDTGFLLCCLSEDSRRVLNTEDLLFVCSFARDLVKHTPELV
ncbi:hypothetical protein JCM11641_000062 [Rhodosporidiobolus odoratus]